MMATFRQTALACFVACNLIPGLLFFASEVRAADVEDRAGFFSAETLKKANAEIAELNKDHNVELRIETFKHIPEKDLERVKKMDQKEHDAYFENLMKEDAKALHAHGILILIWRDPPHMQVAESAAIRKRGFGVGDRGQLRDLLMKGFKAKEYDKALLDGIEFVRDKAKSKIMKVTEGATGPITPRHLEPLHREPVPVAVHRNQNGGFSLMGWIGLAIVVLISVWIVSALLRLLFGGGMRGPMSGGPMGGGYGPGGGYGGYGPGGGGGSMLGGLFSGMAGAMLGNWMYGNLFGHSAYGGERQHFPPSDPSGGFGNQGGDQGGDFEGSGGDFADDGSADGGDFGGGGGGDFGGGDFGGGGGGDFGGGGGDFGGGGGDF